MNLIFNEKFGRREDNVNLNLFHCLEPARCLSAIPVGLPGESTYIFMLIIIVTRSFIKKTGYWGGKDNSDDLPNQIIHVT